MKAGFIASVMASLIIPPTLQSQEETTWLAVLATPKKCGTKLRASGAAVSHRSLWCFEDTCKKQQKNQFQEQEVGVSED